MKKAKRRPRRVFRMREIPLSNCEKDFILKNISEKRRLDGRQAYDYRDVRIAFGVSLGCCHVEIGKTRVLAQVSCEVGQPKQTRPHDGVLFVNVELSPMACPTFEVGRQTQEGVELSRLMERCLKESRCMDLESLCIVAGEKAWHVRIDIHVLNHEGNILDCSSIAAIAALAHFRRPDVTVLGEEITIHSMEERNPVPLSIHHMPLLVSFAFFSQGKFMLVDPSEKEEKVTEGKLVIGMNKYREICTLQLTGQMLLLKDQVLRCSNIAVTKVARHTELIHEALDNDKQARSKGEKHSFAELISGDKITANRQPAKVVPFGANEDGSMESEESEMSSLSDGGEIADMESDCKQRTDELPIKILTKGVGMIGEGGANSWIDLPCSSGVKEKGNESSSTESQKRKAEDDSSEEETPTDDGNEENSSEEETQVVLL